MNYTYCGTPAPANEWGFPALVNTEQGLACPACAEQIPVTPGWKRSGYASAESFALAERFKDQFNEHVRSHDVGEVDCRPYGREASGLYRLICKTRWSTVVGLCERSGLPAKRVNYMLPKMVGQGVPIEHRNEVDAVEYRREH